MGVVLTMIAHGPTRASRHAAFATDEPLEAKVHPGMAALAASLPRADIVLAGPELRTRQSAEALKLDATIDPALRDIDLGRWAGRTLDEVRAAEPDALADWIGRPDAAPHGGESVIGLLARITPWLHAINQRDFRIIAVTHPAVIRAAVIVAIDARPASFWRIDAGPLTRVRLSGDGLRWNLQAIGSGIGAGRETV
jgi:broad specificity phosphatase PhoE